ncbi:hypothetical protein WK03_18810 [Burkholderia cepacia]|uniref:XkdW family protein n=1 Tax=Burkholderia cepacia TaxID=292 RepID=UPI0007598C06|nr:phage tail assembly chaperone [Burkholderia cepacia]KVQ43249.1 hypothetical protein WK03_18810 [Burkholderia cepacia]
MQNFMTLEQLLFILEREYPNLVAGRDYMLARRMDSEAKAVEHARIKEWPSGLPIPDQEWILGRASFYRDEMSAAPVKAYRDQMLTATDWTQGRDVPPALAEQYASYRQALRDVPQQSGWPLDVQWPSPPPGAGLPTPPIVVDVGAFEPAPAAPAPEHDATMPPKPTMPPDPVPLVYPLTPIPEPVTPRMIDPSESPADVEVNL